MTMNIRTIAAFALSFVALAGSIGFGQTAKPETKVQTVKLTIDDTGAYLVTPSNIVNGVPVKMEVDLQSVKGCARTVVISAFNVRKSVKQDDSTVEFTPTKTGEIDIVCGMNMVKGKFTVAD